MPQGTLSPALSKKKLIDMAAYFSLFLTLFTALWPRLVYAIDMVFRDFGRWMEYGTALATQFFSLFMS
jgi:hypothetical protein